MPPSVVWARGLSMKNRFAPFGAVLSVLVFLAWMWSSARNDPSAIEVKAPTEAPTEVPASSSVPASSNDVSVLREQTGGSVIPCGVPLGWRIARVDESFDLSREEARAAFDKAATLWEDAVDLGLFSNESDGALPVRFVSEDRQERTQDGDRLAGVYREAVHTLEGKGISVTREIRIYRFDSLDDLVGVAAHELGHALGLGHSTVSGSVMGEELVRTDGSQGAPRVQPSDVEALRSLCSEL